MQSNLRAIITLCAGSSSPCLVRSPREHHLRRDAARLRLTFALGTLLLFTTTAPAAVAVATELPDPGKLITAAELEPIVGKIKTGPRTVDAPEGAVAAEFTVAEDDSWVTLTIFPSGRYNFDDAKRRFGREGALALPEFGQDAFVNPSVADVAADLYVRKGNVVLEVSIAKGDGAVEKLKAIAKKVLTRL